MKEMMVMMIHCSIVVVVADATLPTVVFLRRSAHIRSVAVYIEIHAYASVVHAIRYLEIHTALAKGTLSVADAVPLEHIDEDPGRGREGGRISMRLHLNSIAQ